MFLLHSSLLTSALTVYLSTSPLWGATEQKTAIATSHPTYSLELVEPLLAEGVPRPTLKILRTTSATGEHTYAFELCADPQSGGRCSLFPESRLSYTSAQFEKIATDHNRQLRTLMRGVVKGGVPWLVPTGFMLAAGAVWATAEPVEHNAPGILILPLIPVIYARLGIALGLGLTGLISAGAVSIWDGYLGISYLLNRPARKRAEAILDQALLRMLPSSSESREPHNNFQEIPHGSLLAVQKVLKERLQRLK